LENCKGVLTISYSKWNEMNINPGSQLKHSKIELKLKYAEIKKCLLGRDL